MKIIALRYPEQHEFLLHLIEAYTRNGMASKDLPIAADLYVAVMNAREMPLEQHVGTASVAGIGPKGIAIDVHPPVSVPTTPVPSHSGPVSRPFPSGTPSDELL